MTISVSSSGPFLSVTLKRIYGKRKITMKRTEKTECVLKCADLCPRFWTLGDIHDLCVFFLGEEHAREVLEGASCANCERFSLKESRLHQASLKMSFHIQWLSGGRPHQVSLILNSHIWWLSGSRSHQASLKVSSRIMWLSGSRPHLASLKISFPHMVAIR